MRQSQEPVSMYIPMLSMSRVQYRWYGRRTVPIISRFRTVGDREPLFYPKLGPTPTILLYVAPNGKHVPLMMNDDLQHITCVLMLTEFIPFVVLKGGVDRRPVPYPCRSGIKAFIDFVGGQQEVNV